MTWSSALSVPLPTILCFVQPQKIVKYYLYFPITYIQNDFTNDCIKLLVTIIKEYPIR